MVNEDEMAGAGDDVVGPNHFRHLGCRHSAGVRRTGKAIGSYKSLVHPLNLAAVETRYEKAFIAVIGSEGTSEHRQK